MEGLIAGIPVLGVIGIIAGALVAIGIIARAARGAWRFLRKLSDVLDDWRGEPARAGVDARPGVMTRLGAIEQHQARTEAHQARTEARLAYVEEQLRPNGGGSLFDKITRIDGRTEPTP